MRILKPRHEASPAAEVPRHHINDAVFSLHDSPLDLELSHYPLSIAHTQRDLELNQTDNPHADFEYVVTAPIPGNPDEMYVLGGLREGQETIVGRKDYPHSNKTFMSRKHAGLTLQGDFVRVRDMSTHGTFYVGDMPEPPDTALGKWNVSSQYVIDMGDMLLTLGGVSAASPDHPDRNEDDFFVSHEAIGMGVFDGVSLADHSDVASSTAAAASERYLSSLPVRVKAEYAAETLRKTLQAVNERVLQRAEEDADLADMATTAMFGRVFRNRAEALYWSGIGVGDSRAGIFRNDRFHQLTIDQSALMHIVGKNAAPVLQKRMANMAGYKRVAQEMHMSERQLMQQLAGIYNYVGRGGSMALSSIVKVDLQPGDKLLLTTDGYHDNMSDAETEHALRQSGDEAILIASSLVDLARNRMAGRGITPHPRRKRDDVAVTVMTVS